MGVITLTFTQPLNESLQIGDTVYYVPTTTIDGFNTGTSGRRVMGTVITIPTPLTLTCNIDDSTPRPGATDFILFSKDNQANMASLLGYYASVTMKNNAVGYAELFSIGSEFSVSSK
jgi:hypothetical protein